MRKGPVNSYAREGFCRAWSGESGERQMDWERANSGYDQTDFPVRIGVELLNPGIDF